MVLLKGFFFLSLDHILVNSFSMTFFLLHGLLFVFVRSFTTTMLNVLCALLSILKVSVSCILCLLVCYIFNNNNIVFQIKKNDLQERKNKKKQTKEKLFIFLYFEIELFSGATKIFFYVHSCFASHFKLFVIL